MYFQTQVTILKLDVCGRSLLQIWSHNILSCSTGPMPDTVKDFWQMIWEQKTPTIVMLTKTMEGNKPKCEKYWPNNVGDTINPKPSLTVKLTQIQLFADYEIRTLQVQPVSLLNIPFYN